MIDRLLNALPNGYDRSTICGVFLSGFDSKRSLILSQGMVACDSSLEISLTSLRDEYFASIQKTVYAVAMDIVTDTVDIHDLSTLNQYDPEEFGFMMMDTDDDLSGVILPHTDGITDAKHALRAMKKKYSLHGKVEIIAFRTHRIILTK